MEALAMLFMDAHCDDACRGCLVIATGPEDPISAKNNEEQFEIEYGHNLKFWGGLGSAVWGLGPSGFRDHVHDP